MKRGREEGDGKVMSALFPRLHVNGADTGGPRAPPRNKMSLYEQLSVPIQRSSNSRVCLTTSSEECGQERGLFPPHNVQSKLPSSSFDKVHSHFSNTMNGNSVGMLERRSSKHTSHVPSYVSRLLRSAADCSYFYPDNYTNSETCGNRCEEKVDCSVLSFTHSQAQIYLSKDPYVMQGSLIHANRSPKTDMVIPSLSSQLQSSHDKVPGKCRSADLQSKGHQINNDDQDVALRRRIERYAPELESGKKTTFSLNIPNISLVDECASKAVNNHNESLNSCKKLQKEICESSKHNSPRCAEAAEKRDDSRVGSGLGQKNLCGNHPEDINTSKTSRGDVGDEASETSILDSIPGIDMSPDDVVGVVGPKHFWKARRAIIDQQRIFTIQVFELHRLIKVQKLIAALPHLLLEINPCFRSPKLPADNLQSENTIKSQPQHMKQKDDSVSVNNIRQCPKENVKRLLPQETGAIKVIQNGPYSGYPPPVPVASVNRPSTWCYHSSVNQWLVPVMTPSEGMTYKPFMGMYPSTAGFMSPIFGGFHPSPHLNPAYGVPTLHQQQNIGMHYSVPPATSNCLPTPYGVPGADPVISVSAAVQPNPMVGSGINEKTQQCSPISFNINSGSAWEFQISKDSELQGSRASTPGEKVQEVRDTLPLFLTATFTEVSDEHMQTHCSDHRTQVIKVVSHNPVSATESAVRIFPSIQKERLQHYST